MALPPTVTTGPVGADLRSIPQECARIQAEWGGGTHQNRITSWFFGTDLNKRMAAVAGSSALLQKRQRVDLLITGCEVSLWVGEQFAADVAQVFPNLAIKVLSSNKLLGLLGQSLSAPQTGFDFTEETVRKTLKVQYILLKHLKPFGQKY
jgi:hypothetical protein